VLFWCCDKLYSCRQKELRTTLTSIARTTPKKSVSRILATLETHGSENNTLCVLGDWSWNNNAAITNSVLQVKTCFPIIHFSYGRREKCIMVFYYLCFERKIVCFIWFFSLKLWWSQVTQNYVNKIYGTTLPQTSYFVTFFSLRALSFCAGHCVFNSRHKGAVKNLLLLSSVISYPVNGGGGTIRMTYRFTVQIMNVS
jgi:hypothetical protein